MFSLLTIDFMKCHGKTSFLLVFLEKWARCSILYVVIIERRPFYISPNYVNEISVSENYFDFNRKLVEQVNYVGFNIDVYM